MLFLYIGDNKRFYNGLIELKTRAKLNLPRVFIHSSSLTATNKNIYISSIVITTGIHVMLKRLLSILVLSLFIFGIIEEYKGSFIWKSIKNLFLSYQTENVQKTVEYTVKAGGTFNDINDTIRLIANNVTHTLQAPPQNQAATIAPWIGITIASLGSVYSAKQWYNNFNGPPRMKNLYKDVSSAIDMNVFDALETTDEVVGYIGGIPREAAIYVFEQDEMVVCKLNKCNIMDLNGETEAKLPFKYGLVTWREEIKMYEVRKINNIQNMNNLPDLSAPTYIDKIGANLADMNRNTSAYIAGSAIIVGGCLVIFGVPASIGGAVALGVNKVVFTGLTALGYGAIKSSYIALGCGLASGAASWYVSKKIEGDVKSPDDISDI